MAKEYKRNIKVSRGAHLPQLLEYYNRQGMRFVPWGRDNLQPNRLLNALSNSPTSSGASQAYSDFMAGQGFEADGEIVVNREGQTLNDVLEFAANQKSIFGGFALHFNFNLLGQINEIQMVKMQLLRVGKKLDTVFLQDWDIRQGAFAANEFPIYQPDKLAGQIKAVGGFKKFKGAVYFKPANMNLYPSMFAESAVLSFEFEKEVQMTSLSFIKNGMKSSGVLKLPSQTSGTADDKKDEAELAKLHEPQTAGTIITLTMPTDAEGNTSDFKMFEKFDIPNNDKMFINQIKSAKDFILSAYNLPMILLGINKEGMFNEGSFSEAFVYFNGKTQKPRGIIEREFNVFMPDTVWSISDLEIVPLDLEQFVSVSLPEEKEPKPTARAKAAKFFKSFFK